MQRLLVLGLNHTTAPLDVRERLAFNAGQCEAALGQLREKFPGIEAVLLSTCNRVELYIARPLHGSPRQEEVAEFLADFHQLQVDSVRPCLYHKSEREMVKHLFNVACSLDSMVLGETQILGQVRSAYDLAVKVNVTGSLLNPLFQRAIAVGKQVMSQTPLAEGRVSVASAAVEYASRIFDHFSDKQVLCIGAGKMARLVLKSFEALAPKKLIIANRSEEPAKVLAEEFRAEVATLDKLDDLLSQVDVVITSTGSSRPIITAAQFSKLQRKRRFKPIFIIDIALPRDVEPGVGELENVYLYNLDDLQEVVSKTVAGRRESIDKASAIVNGAVHEFVRAHRVRILGPMIEQLYKRYHAVAQDELNRTLQKLPNATEAEKEHLQDLARRIVNKLLNEPVQALRRADDTHPGGGDQYAHAMQHLFRLSEALPVEEAGDDDSTETTSNE